MMQGKSFLSLEVKSSNVDIVYWNPWKVYIYICDINIYKLCGHNDNVQ